MNVSFSTHAAVAIGARLIPKRSRPINDIPYVERKSSTPDPFVSQRKRSRCQVDLRRQCWNNSLLRRDVAEYFVSNVGCIQFSMLSNGNLINIIFAIITFLKNSDCFCYTCFCCWLAIKKLKKDCVLGEYRQF